MDCFLVYSQTDSKLTVHKVSSIDSVIEEVADVFVTLNQYYTEAQIKITIDKKLVKTGPSCWALAF